jgi:two-component sensor histidine kinase
LGWSARHRQAIVHSIGARLLLLLLVAEAPLVVFTVGMVLQNDRLLARDAVSRAVAAQSAALMLLAGDMRVAASIAVATASLPDLLLNNRPECDSVLATLVAANAGPIGWISMTDGAGATRCATPGARAITAAAPAIPLGQGTQICGDAFALCVTRRLVPPRDGAVVVTLTRTADGNPADASTPFLWLSGNNRWLPAGTAPEGSLPRQQDQVVSAAEKPLRLRSRDGRPFLYSAVALPAGVGRPGDLLIAGSDIRNAQTASARTFVIRIAQLAGFFIAEFLLIASGVSLVASRPLKRLNDAVDRWRKDGQFSVATGSDGPSEVGQLSQSFGQATQSLDQRERELREATAKQEVLMQEIHHRVKNNLQIVASLLNLQSARIKQPEARAEFQSARDRVRALATLHRHLYAHGDVQMIDMRAFFAELCGQLFQAMDEAEGDRIALEIVAPDVTISSDQAVPIALIVTETVGNAIKYAFPDGRRGRIHVSFEVVDATRATLTVCDDGVGLTERADAEAGEGLGLRLVRGFARQLGAKLTMTTDNGTCYVLHVAIQRDRNDTIALGAARSPVPV